MTRKLAKKGLWRPKTSLMGAHSKGPTANPSTNNDSPRVATSVLTSNDVTILPTLPLYVDDVKATIIVENATTRVMVNFLENSKSWGLRESFGIQDTTYGSSSVPEPG